VSSVDTTVLYRVTSQVSCLKSFNGKVVPQSTIGLPISNGINMFSIIFVARDISDKLCDRVLLKDDR